jgi:hypothetical protein
MKDSRYPCKLSKEVGTCRKVSVVSLSDELTISECFKRSEALIKSWGKSRRLFPTLLPTLGTTYGSYQIIRPYKVDDH